MEISQGKVPKNRKGVWKLERSIEVRRKPLTS